MKILFLQISDLHCTDSSDTHSQKIEKAITALNSKVYYDKVVLILSGDLVDSASKNEFRAARKVISSFISALKREKDCGFIEIKVVPGNHDMYLPEDSRNGATIESWKNQDEHLDEENERLKNFFEYANSNHCFEKGKLYDSQVRLIGGIKVQFCLLNSAIFSTRKREDKQYHYLPSYVGEKIERKNDVDLKITVMHHHYEWCEWNTKEMLKRAIASDDITFFGHDHKSEAVTAYNGNGLIYNIVMGGRFDLDPSNESSFNAVVYDHDTKKLYRYKFDWSVTDKIFVSSEQGDVCINSGAIKPKTEFITKLLKDNQGISDSFEDYYVFPKISVEGEAFSTTDSSECLDEDKIFEALQKVKAIRITGQRGTGKTSLIRHLYAKSVEKGFVPLLIEKRKYESKMDKMFKDLFEEQYPMLSPNSYETYLQVKESSKIVFIDDIDLISNPKVKENLIKHIVESGKLLVYTTKERNEDLEEIIKNKLQDKEVCTIDILLTYKESRDKLIENVGKLHNKSKDDINSIIMALDYLVQCQTGLFSFTPSNMLPYIKYFMNSEEKDRRGGQTISLVYETNIRNSILSKVKPALANIYLTFLEYLSDKMYFDLKTEFISLGSLQQIVDEYNKDRKTEINAKQFLTTACEAGVLKERDSSFEIGFYDKNIYAYFVAKAINREFDRKEDKFPKLMYVMEHICFGINDTIILFLSFIRSNTGLVVKIAEKANELMSEYDEWNFSVGNIPFLHEDIKMSDKAPSAKERKEAHRAIEKVEEERHDIVKFRGIFDYDDSDILKRNYVILRSLKYTQLVGRAFADQYGALDGTDIETLMHTVYSVPQKIIYAMLMPYQENAAKIVKSVIEFAKEQLPGEKVTEQDVKKMLAQAGTILALNVLNDIAFNVSNDCTITALREIPEPKDNYAVFELMMEENTGNTSEFVARAISLRGQLDNSPYAKMLIAQIARKHLIYTSSVDHREIDRLISGKVLSSQSKASLLLGQGSKSKD